MAKARVTEEVKVATENVIAYVQRMRAEGWRLDRRASHSGITLSKITAWR
jgi:hypothetical protein